MNMVVRINNSLKIICSLVVVLECFIRTPLLELSTRNAIFRE